MRCVSTSEKPDTSEHGEQEVSGRSCSQTGIDEANHGTTATSEVDRQVIKTDEEVEKKGEEKITNEKEKGHTKVELELEDWSKSLDEVLQAAGD